MEIVELDVDNLSDYEDILDEDISESIGREFYRGIVAVDDENSPSGAMIWEYKNLEEDADTDAEILFLRSENGETINELLSEFDEQTSDEDVVRSYFETEGLVDEVKEGFSSDGFKVTEKESRDLIISAMNEYMENSGYPNGIGICFKAKGSGGKLIPVIDSLKPEDSEIFSMGEDEYLLMAGKQKESVIRLLIKSVKLKAAEELGSVELANVYAIREEEESTADFTKRLLKLSETA